ncbi:CDP-archaeol synthase [bacterium]|nr:CDP-archaeol synthase [bacterium]
MFLYLLCCLYFFLPAYITNMAPPIVRRINLLNTPVDFGKKWKDTPILGSHKTWRGIFFGLIAGMSMALFQKWLYQFSFIKKISFLDYSSINIFLFGFLISSGALFGDLLFSFLKRRRNIKPGKPWIPFDQIDYVIGSFLFLAPFFKISFLAWSVILVLTFFLHLIVNYLGFLLGISRAKL